MRPYFKNTAILIIASVVAACASTQTANDSGTSFAGAFLEEKGPTKRLILRFQPETPQYQVVHNKENTVSEVRWKANSPQNFQKEFVFTEKGRGVKKAMVQMDAKTQTGTLTLWHEPNDAFTFTRQNSMEFALLPDDPTRKPSSLGMKAQKKISLNVKGAPLDKIIRSLATESSKSLVLASNVTGTVTVTLDNLSYEQALDMILRPTSYRAEHAGDVTIIRSAKDDKTFRSFKIHHIDITDALKRVSEIASRDAQISIDPNANTLFIIDRFESLRNLELLLAQIDVEPRQVDVEAAIVQVDVRDTLNWGIDWNGVAKSGTGNAAVQATAGTQSLSPIPRGEKGFSVGLTWQSVNTLLTALSVNSSANILARPRILALNDQEAEIVLGNEIGYRTVTSTATGQALENVSFLTVGTQLKIRPHITADNDVIMIIKPEISDGSLDATTRLPNKNTTRASTRVLAKNGQTIVIGGLIRNRAERRSDRIPVLGDLPLLGSIFGGTSDLSQKEELVVMLTPRVMTNELREAHDRQSNEYMGRFYDDNGMPIPVAIGTIPVKE